MQKQLFGTTDPDELGKYFFGEQRLDFPKYLHVLMKFVSSREKQIHFIHALVHTESQDGEKEEVLTVETAFYNEDRTQIVRIWGAKNIETGVALLVTIELMNPETKQIDKEYIVIENDVEHFAEPLETE